MALRLAGASLALVDAALWTWLVIRIHEQWYSFHWLAQ